MRKVLLLLVVVLANMAGVKAANPDSLWMRENYIKKEVYIPMRDGVKLFTSVYMPRDKSEKHPILMTRTPYSCAPYGESNYKPYYMSYVMAYLRKGYIIVTQDVRGRWMSEGSFEDVRPFNPNKKTNQDIDEASDTYDTIDWMVKNLENNNGRVGVFGISYPGFYSTMASLSGHPALKAVSPQAPVTDWFMGDDFHHNGAFFITDAFSFYSSFGKPRPHPTTVGPTDFEFHSQDNYDFYLKTGAVKNFTRLLGDTVAFWKEVCAHPNLDAWWKARNVRQYLNNMQPAMLEVGGLFDAEDCFGAWNVYKSIEKQSPNANNKLVMGPWYHGQWASARDGGTHLGNVRWGDSTSIWYEQNIEIPFFEHYLRGQGNDDLAEATVFFTGENQWHKLKQWPPADMQTQSMYLQPDGKLDFAKPKAANSYSEYVSDPSKPVPYTEDVHWNRTVSYMTDDQRFAARRPDVVVFETDTLPNDITLAGPVSAKLVVSTSGTDADFIVKIIDVFPDEFQYQAPEASEHRRIPSSTYTMGGYQMLVRGEIMRGKFRNSFEKPVPFTSNAPTNVNFSIPDMAHTFKKGHRIMIQIQSSWFPLVDRNPQVFTDIYTCDDSVFRKANIRIYHDAQHASHIDLPVIK